jgi:predicted Rossmann-fold nucleotide-binding protein
MTRIATALAWVLAVAMTASQPSAASAAEADTRPCVTVSEWKSYSVWAGGSGGTMRKAHDVFDTEGKQFYAFTDSGHGYTQKWQGRKYKRCASDRFRKVEYMKYNDRPWYSYWG